MGWDGNKNIVPWIQLEDRIDIQQFGSIGGLPDSFWLPLLESTLFFYFFEKLILYLILIQLQN